jgi:hypothetical protein
MSKPVIYWCAAAVLAVGLVLMHVFFRNWALWLVPDLQKPFDEALVSPWAKLVVMGSVVLSVAGGVGVARLFAAGVDTRDRARWAREEEMRRQLREMEAAIREEQMSEEERAWHRRYREHQTEITQEARRRLGLPEEDPRC